MRGGGLRQQQGGRLDHCAPAAWSAPPAWPHSHQQRRRAPVATPLAVPSGAGPRMEQLVQDAVVWASQHGLVVGLGDQGAPEVALVHAPLSLLPVAFPRDRFEQAKAAQPAFNRLVDAVARDEAWLEATLALAAGQDAFTGRLLALLADSRADRERWAHREVVLGVHRSDYMLDAPSGGFLQVELNTIASSFGCLSSLTSAMHAALLGRLAGSGGAAAGAPGGLDAAALPANGAIAELPAAMAAAVAAVGLPGAVVVMVVQPGERNAYDQQWLQAGLWEGHGLRTVRLSLAQLAARCSVRPEDGALLLDGATPVGLVYFRAGYTPADYPGEAEWQARRLVEASSVAKCPSVGYQLAGAKKVQQTLAAPGQLERFVSAQEAAQLRGLFAGLWSLDAPGEAATAAVIAAARADPGAYVLKPQREGGGNNLYGPELAARLGEGGPGLAAYILMQRIRPPAQRSVLVRRGAAAEADTLSELGVYGVYVRRGRGAGGAAGGKVLLDAEAGHLVRTKTATSDEGGVAAGFAVLDSPYLVEGPAGAGGGEEGVLGLARGAGLL